MHVTEIIAHASASMEELVNTILELKPHMLGLDNRSAQKIWIDGDFVIIERSDRSKFMYYAGGEYVLSDCVSDVGDYTVYSCSDPRVQEWVDFYKDYKTAWVD